MREIRRQYRVPAKRGARVLYKYGDAPVGGVVTSADGVRLRIKLDGERRSRIFHPTWMLEYLSAPAAGGE